MNAPRYNGTKVSSKQLFSGIRKAGRNVFTLQKQLTHHKVTVYGKIIPAPKLVTGN